jgi:diguanylate cyclase (GGDEF)-like protein
MDSKKDFHILIVDDEKFNIEIVAQYLKEEGYKLSYATDAQKALEGILKHSVNLILLDINMPNLNGLDFCKILKEDKKTKDIPVIFLSAQTDTESISKGFEVGGVDYITKPFNALELVARVNTHAKNHIYFKEIKKREKKFAQLSVTEPLTKLYNSLYIDSQINIFQKQKQPFWIIFIKLKRFDKVNSLYGYYKANKILKLFAKELKEASLSSFKVARLYGVGFAIVSKDYKKEIFLDFLKKLNTNISNNKNLLDINYLSVFYRIEDESLSIASIYKILQKNMNELMDSTDRYLFL